MIKKLKIGEPIIYAYCHQAALLSVLYEYPETYPWIYSNYIQIYTLYDLWKQKDRLGTLDFYYHFYGDFNFYEYTANPWIDFNKLPYRMVKDRWGTFLEFVKERISKKQYVYMILNRSIYRRDETWWFHPVLIWGYDDNKRELYCADNNRKGKFDTEVISYANFELATDVPAEEINGGDHIGRMGGVCFFNILSDMKYHEVGNNHLLQEKKIKKDLKEFLNPPERIGDYVWGIDCYRELKKYYDYINVEREQECDIRTICSLQDHKVLMKERFRYLSMMGILDYDFETEMNIIINICEIIKKVIIKSNINRHQKFPSSKLNNYLDELEEKEYEIYKSVIQSINYSKGENIL